MSQVAFLECTRCGEALGAEGARTVCPKDGGVLFARYDLRSVGERFRPEIVTGREATQWRYREVLPEVTPVTLGEGLTPLVPSREFPNVWIKDEGLNPTGSFKARGVSVALSVAKSLGWRKFAMPSAGNAGSALAAYAAAAQVEAHIFMPQDVPEANRIECENYGARVQLVRGLIGDCARLVSERRDQEGWFDLSTLKEPYRVEGKKTMGYELFEQLGGKLPDCIVFPTGGGVGVIGIAKAFDEMEQLGWIGAARPRMIAVQSEGCAPLVRAWEKHQSLAEPWTEAATIAAGLRVPRPYGDYLVLRALERSQGMAVSVTDEEIRSAAFEWAGREGILPAPEGAASLAAYRKLRGLNGLRAGASLSENDRVVLFNTGTGLKYLDVLKPRSFPRPRRMGGIIQPY